MLKVNYCERGVALSDFKASEFVDSFVFDYLNTDNKETKVFETANELVLNYFVLKVMNGTLSFDEVLFYYQDIPLKCEKSYGLDAEVDGKVVEVGFNCRLNIDILNEGVKYIRSKMSEKE